MSGLLSNFISLQKIGKCIITERECTLIIHEILQFVQQFHSKVGYLAPHSYGIGIKEFTSLQPSSIRLLDFGGENELLESHLLFSIGELAYEILTGNPINKKQLAIPFNMSLNAQSFIMSCLYEHNGDVFSLLNHTWFNGGIPRILKSTKHFNFLSAIYAICFIALNSKSTMQQYSSNPILSDFSVRRSKTIDSDRALLPSHYEFKLIKLFPLDSKHVSPLIGQKQVKCKQIINKFSVDNILKKRSTSNSSNLPPIVEKHAVTSIKKYNGFVYKPKLHSRKICNKSSYECNKVNPIFSKDRNIYAKNTKRKYTS